MYSTGNTTAESHRHNTTLGSSVLAAVASVEAAIGMVLSLGLEPDTADQANGLLEALETVSRRVEAGHVQLMDRIDCKNLWTTDGMLSAKTMVRHRTGVSSAEAGARLKVVKCCRRMPVVEAAYRAGQISTCNMRCLAHVFSNKRVRTQLVVADEIMSEQAAGLSALEFRLWVGDWESLTDEDGTCDTNQRNHENRDARMVQDFDKGWTFEAWCAAFQGAEMYKIWAKFIDAEFKTDWAKAVAVHGVGNVTKDMLERSVTIDHSRTVRLFAGPAANAVRATQTRCYWPGCEIPISNCQIDHLKPDRSGGTTDPANGGGACGKHNRYKETGYTVHRKPDGTWNVIRPDGQLVQ